MATAFISYVKEDSDVVALIKTILEKNGVEVFLDSEKLVPGQRWKNSLETAIREGTFFLSVYSQSRENRERSYVHEETNVAIEEIRRRPASRIYFIPIKIDEAEIEDRSIGGGERISDLHFCDLRDWPKGMRNLLAAVGISDPETSISTPLAPGLPGGVSVTKGSIEFTKIERAPAMMQGMRFFIDGGWCQRTDEDHLLTYLRIKTPFRELDRVNEIFGLNSVHALSQDTALSTDPNSPTEFFSTKRHYFPAGTTLPDIMSGKSVTLPVALEIEAYFSAKGSLTEHTFRGIYQGGLRYFSPMALPETRMFGDFELEFAPDDFT